MGDYVAILLSNNGELHRRTGNLLGSAGPDVTAPIISLIGGLSISVVENSNFTDPGWSAIDDRDEDISGPGDSIGRNRHG